MLSLIHATNSIPKQCDLSRIGLRISLEALHLVSLFPSLDRAIRRTVHGNPTAAAAFQFVVQASRFVSGATAMVAAVLKVHEVAILLSRLFNNRKAFRSQRPGAALNN